MDPIWKKMVLTWNMQTTVPLGHVLPIGIGSIHISAPHPLHKPPFLILSTLTFVIPSLSPPEVGVSLNLLLFQNQGSPHFYPNLPFPTLVLYSLWECFTQQKPLQPGPFIVEISIGCSSLGRWHPSCPQPTPQHHKLLCI